MSLLLANGHPDARNYPIGMLIDEANLVIERANLATVLEANLLQQAIHGFLSDESRKLFKKLIDGLPTEAEPFRDYGEDEG